MNDFLKNWKTSDRLNWNIDIQWTLTRDVMQYRVHLEVYWPDQSRSRILLLSRPRWLLFQVFTQLRFLWNNSNWKWHIKVPEHCCKNWKLANRSFSFHYQALLLCICNVIFHLVGAAYSQLVVRCLCPSDMCEFGVRGLFSFISAKLIVLMYSIEKARFYWNRTRSISCWLFCGRTRWGTAATTTRNVTSNCI